jgi:hypothetical protein
MGLVDERFWQKVDRRGVDDCWPWKASKFKQGYGRFSLKGRRLKAHRVAYALTYGELPTWTVDRGIVIRHRCDNKICCNPAHLETGSQAENVRDRDVRGRTKVGVGERHGRAVLTEMIVLAIRERVQNGERQVDVAADLNIPRQYVNGVVHRKIWKHI